MYRRILILSSLFLLFTAFLSSPAFCQESLSDGNIPEHRYIRAKIIEVVDLKGAEENEISGVADRNQLVTVELLDNDYKGQKLEILHTLTNHPGYDVNIKPGDEVILYAEPEGDKLNNVYIENFARDNKLFYMVVLFIVLLAIVGRKQGVKSIFTLTFTVGSVFFVLLPLMLKGYNPILASHWE